MARQDLTPPPQRRTLIRARDLAAFREAVLELSLAGGPLAARSRAVIVPTRASAELLRQTLERRAVAKDTRAVVLPDLLTREDWLMRLRETLPGAPAMLTRAEREILLERAARAAGRRTRMSGQPFQLRPGLVAAMLDLYDELARRQRTVRRFAAALFDQLRVERGTDRGSEGLVHQTAFLAFSFLGYQRGVAASDAIDEHELRRHLLHVQPALPFSHVVLAVADHPSDPRGLRPADFDLVGRLRGLSRVDVVMTDEIHDAGFRDRLERELPGIDEARHEAGHAGSVLVRPLDDAHGGSLCFVSRDREEELRDVARAIRARARRAEGALDESVAVVFHRPLPYLYLAQQVLADARVPYQTFDAQPLATEPYAALLDLVMTVARTGGTREAAGALLRSTMLRFEDEGVVVGPSEAAALDLALAHRRATGEADTYLAEAEEYFAGRASRGCGSQATPSWALGREGALRAARVAARIREELAPFRTGASASLQVRAIARFLRCHEHGDLAGGEWGDRHRRARAAVLGVLDGLAAAFERHDDASRPHEDITAAVRHAIEAQTFSPRRGTRGVQLVDAVASRFGEFDHVHLVGLVETDWPERPARSIFFTTGLLKALGWPQEPDQMRAEQAAFRDLLKLARRTTTLHAFQLEGDAIVALSPMVDEARDLPSVVAEPVVPPRVFADEVLTIDAAPPPDLEPVARAWLDLRRARPSLEDRRYRGYVTERPPQAYRISRVDHYVDCPFRYFAENVLSLPDEREDAAGLTPLERGTLIHELFERFYQVWQAQGGAAITPATLSDATALFARLTREALATLPAADRALEETRLLGSIVGRGVGERVFELEADAGGDVVKRLLEFDLRGPFTFPQLSGLKQRDIEVRGKADRIDVLADGTLRVIDYKLGRLPDLDSSLQIAVYAHAARQLLEAQESRPYSVGGAMYLAFGDDRKLEGRLGGQDPKAVARAVEARATEFANAIDEIEAGRFPPRPRRSADCQWCRYAGVCRKEYVADDDEPTEPV